MGCFSFFFPPSQPELLIHSTVLQSYCCHPRVSFIMKSFQYVKNWKGGALILTTLWLLIKSKLFFLFVLITEVEIGGKRGEDCHSLLFFFPLRFANKHSLGARSCPVKMCIYIISLLNFNFINKSTETIRQTKHFSYNNSQ